MPKAIRVGVSNPEFVALRPFEDVGDISARNDVITKEPDWYSLLLLL
jgi:hypothetical protein